MTKSLDIKVNTQQKMKPKHIKTITLGIIILLIIGLGYFIMTNKEQSSKRVVLETTEGEIIIELYKEMPLTAGNFESLVNKGFYNGVIFHRVIEGFMIQGGDPTGTGQGGPGYEIKDEFTRTSKDENNRGTISMANAGPNTRRNQFFINLVNNNFLDGRHPVFGKVVKGMDVVDKIAKLETDSNDKPRKDIKILSAKVQWITLNKQKHLYIYILKTQKAIMNKRGLLGIIIIAIIIIVIIAGGAIYLSFAKNTISFGSNKVNVDINYNFSANNSAKNSQGEVEEIVIGEENLSNNETFDNITDLKEEENLNYSELTELNNASEGQ